MDGIHGLSGYSYQMRVFIYYLSLLREGDKLSFEYVDDITLTKQNVERQLNNKYPKFLIKNEMKVIQVKQTNFSKSIAKKVLLNWLIEKKENDISKFVLCCNGENDIDEQFDKVILCELYSEIKSSDERSTSLKAKVKEIYCSYDEFRKDSEFILQNFESKKIDDINEEIIQAFKIHFNYTNEGSVTYQLRITDLINTIQSEIIEAILQRQYYEINYSELMELIERIQCNITRNKFQPQWTMYQNKYLDLNNPVILNSREFRQLKYCNLRNEDILKGYLRKKEFYLAYRLGNLENCQKSHINELELNAYANYEMVLEDMNQGIYNDTPYLRLRETTKMDNAAIVDNHCKEGVCIYLTGDFIDKNRQISWKDDEDE